MEPVVYFKFLVFIYHTLILSNMKNSFSFVIITCHSLLTVTNNVRHSPAKVFI